MNKHIIKIISSALSMTLLSIIVLTPFSTLAVYNPCTSSNIRWSASSNRVYIFGDVTCTLTDIKSLGSKYIPLELVDSANKIWLLKANIILQNGATLKIHSEKFEGDTNGLRLKSNNANLNDYISISADWGNIDIFGVKITSWDELSQSPDVDYSNGRAFIRVRSRLDDNGIALESRMDIARSDISYLGFNASESYGLSWKVLTNSLAIFDLTNVYGGIINSRIHNNFFGAYTYGGQNMKFTGNEVSENIWYGLDPHDDSDYLVISDNYVHRNGKHGIICSKRCDNITISNNRSNYNNGNGIFLHREVTDSIIENNTTEYNSDSGIAIFDSYDNIIRNNISKYNEKGIRLSVGSSNNIIENNDFSNNSKYGIYTYEGNDLPANQTEKVVNLNTFRNNTITYNAMGIRFNQAKNNFIEGNNIFENQRNIYNYDTSNNIFLANITNGNNITNYHYERYNSKNIIKDTDNFFLKIFDDLSETTIINSQNYIIQNIKKIATDFYPDKSSLTVNKIKAGASIINYEKMNLMLKPTTGKLSAIITKWNKDGDFGKSWTEQTISSPDMAVAHLVGDLNPGFTYNVTAGLNSVGDFIANSSGVITFTYNLYNSSENILFNVLPK